LRRPCDRSKSAFLHKARRPYQRPEDHQHWLHFVDRGETYIVDRLRGLVDGNDGSRATQVGRESQGPHKLEGSGRIEASRGVVPALDWTLTQGGLGDTDPLALTTTDTTDEVVANRGIQSMGQAERGHDDVSHMRRILLAGDAWNSVAWSPRCAT
jgi:hypothetical protein